MRRLFLCLLFLAALLVAFFDAPPLAPLMAKAPPAVPRTLGAIRRGFVEEVLPAARSAWAWSWPRIEAGTLWLVHEAGEAFRDIEGRIGGSHAAPEKPAAPPGRP